MAQPARRCPVAMAWSSGTARWRRTLSLLLLLFLALHPGAADAGALELSGGRKWVVIASRPTLSEAVEVARDYGSARVVSSDNGWFAVVLGPVTARRIGEVDLATPLPSDAYLARGANFIETVWPETGSQGGATADRARSCAHCFLIVAWGFWNDASGGARVVTALGWGASEGLAENEAISACRSRGGRNCKRDGETAVASYGLCRYVVIGKAATRVASFAGPDRAEVLERCRNDSDGYSCQDPIGGCTSRPE